MFQKILGWLADADCIAVIPVTTLFRATQVMLRLSLLDATSPQLLDLVSVALARLASVEHTLPTDNVVKPMPLPALPPHSGQDLFKSVGDEDVLWWYGQCVETLWRVTMSSPEPSSQWADLTHKLLVWRAHAGSEHSMLGEWARREVVRNLA